MFYLCAMHQIAMIPTQSLSTAMLAIYSYPTPLILPATTPEHISIQAHGLYPSLIKATLSGYIST